MNDIYEHLTTTLACARSFAFCDQIDGGGVAHWLAGIWGGGSLLVGATSFFSAANSSGEIVDTFACKARTCITTPHHGNMQNQ